MAKARRPLKAPAVEAAEKKRAWRNWSSLRQYQRVR
jgi:hypothetical protein